jgi:O-antigen/teichoic acid export membrane protein
VFDAGGNDVSRQAGRAASAVPDSAPTLAGGFFGVTAAGLLGNSLSYLLLLVAARKLGSVEYGELVTLLNILLVGYVSQLAIQTVVARRIATQTRGGLLRATLLIGFGASAALALLTPALKVFLHLPSWAGMLFVALALPGIAVQGLCQGIWQGLGRFHALAISTFVGIVGRSGVGLAGLLIGKTSTITLGCIAAGVTVSAGLSFAATAHAREAIAHTPHELRHLMAECGHASHAFGVFLLLSATDLLLARHTLSTTAAAVYAAGSVLTRIALWFPQSIANVLFASLTDVERHRALFIRAIAALTGLGALMVAGSFVLNRLVTAIVAGNKYPELRPDVWLFAALGASLAVLQFALVAGLAVRSTVTTVLLWLAVATEVGVVLRLGQHATVHRIVASVFVINLVAATAAVLLRIRTGHSDSRARPEPA